MNPSCVCSWFEGRVTSMCGAHHEAAYKMYGARLAELENTLKEAGIKIVKQEAKNVVTFTLVRGV